ncbi:MULTISPECIES: dTDP-4-dehydrorhamnose reductase family protein [Polaromonas]|uniref:dTDP-4-dehydrorhamnose reductase n=1 Tax=Polaromonas aquatica TaxID=332657 RepID=A0ABW1U2C6_9BURK
MKVMVLGVTGMLGSAMFRVLSEHADLAVYGTARSDSARQHFSENLSTQIIVGTDVESSDSLVSTFATVRPDVVVNCVGLVKQLAKANDPLQVIPINTLLPHRLAVLCQATGARLVHISTDCVFSGAKGNYVETDFPDARDLYGRSKLLGEVDYPNAITLRTSIIGHELTGNRSLVNWFLAQQQAVNGFTRVIFSGLPTVELATVVRDVVLPIKGLRGLYHVSAKPINKFDLLQMLSKTYGKNIKINPSEEPAIDRSLNSDRFREATGYTPPDWPALVQRMFEFK